VNSQKLDDVFRIQKLPRAEWESGVSLGQAYSWWHDLATQFVRAHDILGGAGVGHFLPGGGEAGLFTRTKWLAERAQEAEEELERLQAIVDKLSYTDDGVPLVPGRIRYIVAQQPTPGREPYVEEKPCERPMHPHGWSTHALAVKAVRAREREYGWTEDRLTPLDDEEVRNAD